MIDLKAPAVVKIVILDFELEFTKFNSTAIICLDIKLNSKKLNEIVQADLTNYSLFFIHAIFHFILFRYLLKFLDYFTPLLKELFNLSKFNQHF